MSGSSLRARSDPSDSVMRDIGLVLNKEEKQGWQSCSLCTYKPMKFSKNEDVTTGRTERDRDRKKGEFVSMRASPLLSQSIGSTRPLRNPPLLLRHTT